MAAAGVVHGRFTQFVAISLRRSQGERWYPRRATAFSNRGRRSTVTLQSSLSCFIAWRAPRPRSAAHQERGIALVPTLSGHTLPSAAPDGGRADRQCRRAPIAGVAVSASSGKSRVWRAQDPRSEASSRRTDGRESLASSGPPEI